jgi:hypothetical protein
LTEFTHTSDKVHGNSVVWESDGDVAVGLSVRRLKAKLKRGH